MYTKEEEVVVAVTEYLNKLGFIEICSIDNNEVISQGYIQLKSIVQIFNYDLKEIENKLYAPIDYTRKEAIYDAESNPVKGKINVKFGGYSYASDPEHYHYIEINPNN